MWSPEELLQYWFGELDSDGVPPEMNRQAWFTPSRTRDAEIRRRFMGMVTLAEEGGLDHWSESPHGTLAALLLLDQFPRQIYRGMSLAFGSDAHARRWMRQGLERSQDVMLPLIMRAFFYMPLQHSERLTDQEEAVALYDQLVHQSEGRLRDVLSGFLSFARQHRDIIAQFGRFPHRNKVLGRPETEAERAWLAASGSRFGQ
ncbi:MAG: DUF924 domain-containing protein [Gammaproteobacteria bacterium]|nr:MAG: DUF924 domain-containing protein [Gammaproteobacteria bacterium]